MSDAEVCERERREGEYHKVREKGDVCASASFSVNSKRRYGRNRLFAGGGLQSSQDEREARTLWERVEASLCERRVRGLFSGG